MLKIQKAHETMTAKERVLKTFDYEKVDRVPINYFTNITVFRRLCDELGITSYSMLEMYDALGVDYRSAWPQYKGPLVFKEIEGMDVNPEYGFYTKWIPHSTGGYHDFCYFPLKNADEEAIRNFPVTNPDYYDYDSAIEIMKYYKDYAIYVGNAGIADIINSLGRLMGMEDTLVNLYQEDEATLDLAERKVNMELEIMERMLDKAKGIIDFVWIGEDLGTQRAPMISLQMYRRILKPLHNKFIKLAKAYDLPVMVHTCGSSSWVYEDFIKMGINAVDTLQPEAADMSPEYLKEKFGGRLSFHGCISTAGTLANGTANEVCDYVEKTLNIMMPGGGYHFSPTHAIQDNTPVENIVAMYQTAHLKGRYL